MRCASTLRVHNNPVKTQGRLKMAQSAVAGVKHPSHGAATIFGLPSAEVHRLLAQPMPAQHKHSRVRELRRSRQERHAAALAAYHEQRETAHGMLCAWVKDASAECSAALQVSADRLGEEVAALQEAKVMVLSEEELMGVRSLARSVRSTLQAEYIHAAVDPVAAQQEGPLRCATTP